MLEVLLSPMEHVPKKGDNYVMVIHNYNYSIHVIRIKEIDVSRLAWIGYVYTANLETDLPRYGTLVNWRSLAINRNDFALTCYYKVGSSALPKVTIHGEHPDDLENRLRKLIPHLDKEVYYHA